MKKYIFIFALLLFSFFITPLSFNINAKEIKNNDFEIFYPENVLEYKNLENISNISASNNYIAYKTENTKLNIIDIKNRNFKEYSFTNIQNFKFINDNCLILIDDNNAKLLNVEPYKIIQIPEFKNINSKLIDIYSKDSKLYICYCENTSLVLHTYDINKTNHTTINNHEQKIILKNENFEKVSNITINEKYAYLLVEKNNDSSTKLLDMIKINYDIKEKIKKEFKPNAQLIDTFIINNEEYFLTFTKENLFLLKYNNDQYEDVIQISISTKNAEKSNIINKILSTNKPTNFPILQISSFDICNNKIYIADSMYKTISAYNILFVKDPINQDKYNIDLDADRVLISSNSSDIGRFDNINNITFHEDNVFITDTNNDRIQIINKDKKIQVIELNTGDNPRNLVVDRNKNIFFITGDNSKSYIQKYSINENNLYTFEKQFDTINSSKFGYISDLDINPITNEIYFIEQTRSTLLSIKNEDVSFITDIEEAQKNSLLEFIENTNKLVIFNNNKLQLLSSTDMKIISNLVINNCKDITSSLSKIYALSENKIEEVEIVDDTFVLTNKTYTNDYLNNINKIQLNIKDNKFWGFNFIKQCLVTFNNNSINSELDFIDITNLQNLDDNENIKPLKTNKQTTIYEYPYNIGKLYNINENTNLIGIELYNNTYYRTIFNNNNVLTVGFIKYDDISIINTKTEIINVIVTNQKIPVYKYPTLLKYNDNTLTVDTLTINTPIQLFSLFPSSIDQKDFYLYKNGNKTGYIFSADIILNDSKNIQYFKIENATINTYGNDYVTIYDENTKREITTITNNYRIYVENYDKNSKYTKISYKDKNLNKVEGIVETKYIMMDKLDNSKIILIVIILISIIILITIVICVIKIKKKD